MKRFFRIVLIKVKEINMKAGSLLGGCLFYGIGYALYIYCAITVVLAVIGLVTGHLYLLPGKGSPNGLTIHGVWARIISGIILAISAAILRNVLKQRREKRCALIEQNNKDSDKRLLSQKEQP